MALSKMVAHRIVLIFLHFSIALNLRVNGVTSAKYEIIGDCNWMSGSEHNETLTFICYDHFHEDRFFNYDSAKKPCLNNKSGYTKDNIGQIQFQNCQFSKLPYDIIEYYRFVWQLNISDIGLKYLSKSDFNGKFEQRVRTLLASHNGLMEIEVGLFDNAKHVIEADFSFNKINRIDPSAFANSNGMQSLDLSSNKLTNCGDGTFRHLHNLKTLILRDNNIAQTDSMTFAELKSLTKLDLSHNKLSKLSSGVFEVHTLKMLNLSNNEISEIDAIVFATPHELVVLDLSFNCISNMSHLPLHSLFELTELYISHNQLQTLDALAAVNLSKLAVFDASNNFVSDLKAHVFDSFVNLIDLNLSFNPLKLLKSEIFSKLTNLLHLKLSNTSLTTIESGAFFKPSHLQTINLSRNHLNEIDLNIFLPNLSELNSLYLDGNQLTNLIGFRRQLFPNLRILGIQDNRFNCSYLRIFFESMVWHELNIQVDRSRSFELDSNVGGIKCIEPIKFIASTQILDKSSTLSSNLTSTVAATSMTPNTTPSPTSKSSSPSSALPSSTAKSHPTSSSLEISTKSTTHSQICDNRNVELLLTILCIILIALFLLHIVINRHKICGRFMFQFPQNNLQSMATLDSEYTVAYSAK